MVLVRNLMLLFLAVTLSLAGCGDKSSDSGSTAEAIIANMRQAYATCATYQDTGVVTTTDQTLTSSTISFTTAYVRQNRFRFEFQGTGVPEPYIVWRDGTEVLSWADINPGTKTEDSIGMALATATGISDSSSATIPSLLFSDEMGLYFDVQSPQRMADDEVNGVNCYQIQDNSVINPSTIWIDKKTYLILRIKTRYTSPDLSFETVTTYAPIANGAIPDEALAFNPPQ